MRVMNLLHVKFVSQERDYTGLNQDNGSGSGDNQ